MVRVRVYFDSTFPDWDIICFFTHTRVMHVDRSSTQPC